VSECEKASVKIMAERNGRVNECQHLTSSPMSIKRLKRMEYLNAAVKLPQYFQLVMLNGEIRM
jgi:hypothetical protein